MIKNDLIFLEHILNSLHKIQDYSHDLDMDTFVKNTLIQDALIRQFEVIGEAAKNISQELKSKHPQIQWGRMTGMRNKLIHKYFDIDLNILWESVNTDVPTLLTSILPIMEDLENQ